MLNLEKSKQVVLDLTKTLGIGDQKAQVVLAIDYSGSMMNLYHDGTVQRIVERIIPIAMAFDDNEAVEVYRFDHNSKRITTEVTPRNYKGFVDKYVNTGSMGGTNYTPVMEDITKDFTKSGGGSFIKKLFGSKTMTDTQAAELPVYVIFVTDGDCSDVRESLNYIKEISNKEIFWQFVGVGYSTFRTLEQLDTVSGRVVDNANFFQIRDSSELLSMTDEQLYGKLLHEFPDWLKQAKQLNIIK